MNLDVNLISTNAIVVVPIVIGLTQAIKMTGYVRDHYAPLLSIAIGVLVGFVVNGDNPDLAGNLLSGAIYGLTASGLYSSVKTQVVAHAEMKQKQKQKEKQKQSNNQKQC